MDATLAALPDDVDVLKAALLAARAETAIVLAEQSSNRALIALGLTRFGGHPEAFTRGANDAQIPTALFTGVPSPDGRSRSFWS